MVFNLDVLIFTIMFIFTMIGAIDIAKDVIKSINEPSLRLHSREFPDGWFKNLANLVISDAQIRKKYKNVYEIYKWKHNNYEILLYIYWRDSYEYMNDFIDLPVLMSSVIKIYNTQEHFYKKRVFKAYVDKSIVGSYENEKYYNEYNIKKNSFINIKTSKYRGSLNE